MNLTQKYDEIIFGGSLSGIIYALNKKRTGMNVLLINHYGFPGGSITSAFNCLQVQRKSEEGSLFNTFITSVKHEKYGFLYSDSCSIVINPETVKMKLINMIKASGIDLLFHVNPVSISVTEGNAVELELNAKEGRIRARGCSLLDASENHLMYKLHNKTAPAEILKRVNLFITKPEKLSFADYDQIQQIVRLVDGRCWISLNAENAEDNTDSENIINDFNPLLMTAGSRIQLMPLEGYSYYKLRSLKNIDEPVHTIEELLGKNFLPNEQLIKALETENYLTCRQNNK